MKRSKRNLRTSTAKARTNASAGPEPVESPDPKIWVNNRFIPLNEADFNIFSHHPSKREVKL